MPEQKSRNIVPVWRTVGLAYGYPFMHLADFWGPYLVMAVMVFVDLQLLTGHFFPGWISIPAWFVVVFLFSYLNVGTMRIVLFRFRDAPYRFAFDRTVVYFFGTSVLFGLAVAVSNSLAAHAANHGPLARLILAPWQLFFSFCIVRIALTFPAIVSGDKKPFRVAWAATRGSFWRLVAISLVLVVPFIIFVFLVVYMGSRVRSTGVSIQLAHHSILALMSICLSVFLIVALVVQSVCYEVLVNGRKLDDFNKPADPPCASSF